MFLLFCWGFFGIGHLAGFFGGVTFKTDYFLEVYQNSRYFLGYCKYQSYRQNVLLKF